VLPTHLEAGIRLRLLPHRLPLSEPRNMLSAVYKAGRAPAVLRHGRRVPVASSQLRPLVTGSNASPFRTQADAAISSRLPQRRLLSATAAMAAVAQQAPNPKAYLESGVIKPKEHVDVKKVLVIGSGGLSIGQAGEFDYSGMFGPEGDGMSHT